MPAELLSVLQAVVPQTLACIIFSAWKDLFQQVIPESYPTLCFPLSIMFLFFIAQFKHYLPRMIWSPGRMIPHSPPYSTAQHYIYFLDTWHNVQFLFNFVFWFGANLSTRLCGSQEQKPCLTSVWHINSETECPHSPVAQDSPLLCLLTWHDCG